LCRACRAKRTDTADTAAIAVENPLRRLHAYDTVTIVRVQPMQPTTAGRHALTDAPMQAACRARRNARRSSSHSRCRRERLPARERRACSESSRPGNGRRGPPSCPAVPAMAVRPARKVSQSDMNWAVVRLRA
jgi:hypothetical protein